MGGIVGLLVVSFAALIGGILAVRVVRRWAHRRPTPQPPAFDQAELHGMLASGQISPAEYERLRALVLMQQSRTLASDVSAGARGFEPLPLSERFRSDRRNPPAGR